jgi:HEAT repeat protein
MVAKAVYDKRWFVVRNAVMILGRIGNKRALSHLSKVVRHEDLRVRRELIAALIKQPSQGALDLLRSLISDQNQEIRRKAIDAVVARGGAAAFEAIGAVIDDEGFLNVDRHEQQRLLNAYSSLGGEQAVDFLSQLILKFNVFRDSTLTFLRQAAFEALTVNGSDESEQLLKRLARSWRPDVRHRAVAALHRRPETGTMEVT